MWFICTKNEIKIRLLFLRWQYSDIMKVFVQELWVELSFTRILADVRIIVLEEGAVSTLENSKKIKGILSFQRMNDQSFVWV